MADQALLLEQPTLRIVPPRGWLDIDLRELWDARELLYFFVWRDIKIRYKQTAIGAACAIIQPFMTMVVFSLFFGSERAILRARSGAGADGIRLRLRSREASAGGAADLFP